MRAQQALSYHLIYKFHILIQNRIWLKGLHVIEVRFCDLLVVQVFCKTKFSHVLTRYQGEKIQGILRIYKKKSIPDPYPVSYKSWVSATLERIVLVGGDVNRGIECIYKMF